MKKYNKFGYVGAMMLAGLVSFSSCSSDDDVTQEVVNPSYDGESVKTKFALSIPRAAKNGRMSAQNTQAGGNNFLGMNNIYMFPLKSQDANFQEAAITLGNIAGFQGDEKGGVKVYNDVKIPVGTTDFLFYAGSGNFETQNFEDGALQSNLSNVGSKDELNFNLVSCFKEGAEGNTLTEVQDNLTKALSKIANAQVTVDHQTYNWESAGTQIGGKEGENLEQCFTKFTSLTSGSGPSILATLKTLLKAVQEIGDAAGSETNVKKLADAIKNAILTNNLWTGKSYENLAWQDGTLYEKFPEQFQIPQGTMVLSYNDGFNYGGDLLAVGNAKLNKDDLRYPAAINYFISSPLAANNTYEKEKFPTSLSDWKKASWSEWGTKVEATTKMVAMKNPVNYGVGLMKTTIKFASPQVPSADGQVKVLVGDGFEISGIFVGGQPKSLDWNFMPKGQTSDWTDVIYDKEINGLKATVKGSDPNYTLVLPNTISGTLDGQQVVNIVVELVNESGYPFKGKEGVVPAGHKFYLVAELDPQKIPNDKQGAVTLPDGTLARSVFMKDCETQVNLKISSLENAYMTIPDLRSTELAFGMAVDLSWTPGLVFEDVELGGM